MNAIDIGKAKTVLICCRKPEAFRRAHIWALNRGMTSLLTTPTDWPNAAALAATYGADCVMTDEPEQAKFEQKRVMDTARLPLEPVCEEPGAWPEPVAILFTSGSTGTPKPVIKDARAILGEFALLKAWFGGAPMGDFISTVPLEHMFGYTFGFWLPLLMKAALLARRPVAPADLRSACAASQSPAWVITTPTHLRAYVQLAAGFDNVAGLVCATSPLGTDLARAAAARFRAPITEIYGSTESGAVAARLWTADGQGTPGWMPLPGIDIRPGPAGTAVCGIPYIKGAVELSDLIEMDGTSFKVLGRTGDLVKIGGKRHSLAALNQLLAGAPGVRDSVYFLPQGGPLADAQRAAALVVLAEGYSSDDVLGALRGKVDDVFLPRPIHVIKGLPRTGAGKIRDADLQQVLLSLAQNAVPQSTRQN